MDDNSPGIAPSEFVLRRIHKNQFVAGNPVPIQRVAFEPKPDENDGISVYRESEITAMKLAVSGRRPGEYHIARLLVGDLLAMNLTVIPSPNDDLPGHAVIPELNWQSFQRDMPNSKDMQRKLAILASQAIVYRVAES